MAQVSKLCVALQIFDNKAFYHIKNTAYPCLAMTYLCEPTNKTMCANPKEYFFWDGVHPSTVTHEILAQKLYKGVRALMLQGQASMG